MLSYYAKACQKSTVEENGPMGTGTRRQHPAALLIDLYELTMAEVYFGRQMFRPATFSLYIRDFPSERGFYISAGLEKALAFLETVRFSADDLGYLDSTGLFSAAFLEYLADFRFRGEVFAIPEGRLFFGHQPVVEVTAPIIDAQLVETVLINILNLQVNMATKVCRCTYAAQGRKIVDFSLRRTQGEDAAMAVARAGYIAGMSATSNVMAGKELGIPVAGTMAHSFVTSFEKEIDAFRAYAEHFGDRTILLIDTYDTLSGAIKAVTVGREMAARNQRLEGVRLDSGDMTDLSRRVRGILDEAGLEDVKIFASGGFDEFKIDQAVRDGAAIDAFGVGTKMGVSADSPYTDMAYKLVQYDGRPVMKLSSGKRTLVAPKQVYRLKQNGYYGGDTIALREEELAGDALLILVMQGGKRSHPPETLDTIRSRFEEEFERLPQEFKSLKKPAPYPVEISDRLGILQRNVKRRIVQGELVGSQKTDEE
jgi:nicotinate phosphoribosyltransferase